MNLITFPSRKTKLFSKKNPLHLFPPPQMQKQQFKVFRKKTTQKKPENNQQQQSVLPVKAR